MPVGYLLTGGLGRFTAEAAVTNPASIGQSVEAALLGILVATPFDGLDPANVAARKLPRVSETLAPQPPCCILAAGAQGEGWEPISTEGVVDYLYYWEIAFVKGGNLDMSADPQVRLWDQQARRAVGGDAALVTVRAAAPTVWWVEIRPDPLFDRANLATGYSYSGFTAVVHSAEQR